MIPCGRLAAVVGRMILTCWTALLSSFRNGRNVEALGALLPFRKLPVAQLMCVMLRKRLEAAGNSSDLQRRLNKALPGWPGGGGSRVTEECIRNLS